MTTTSDLDEIMTSTINNDNTEDENQIKEKDLKEAETNLETDLQ
jgi:hypothetical protein